MARIRTECIDRVRDAVDFVELVGERIELRRASARAYEGLCPFHEERTPSFTIEPERKLYYCFGCQASGDLFGYLQALEGLDFPAALELLADRCGIEVEYEDEDPRAAERRSRNERLRALLERAGVHYARVLWESAEATEARRYLADRGLGEEILQRFQVGYAPGSWDHLLRFARAAGFTDEELRTVGLTRESDGRTSDYFRGRIIFPLRDARGRVIGFGARATREDQRPKYINTPEGPLYHKGRHLYGLDLARAHATRAGQVLVCEGYTDVLALHQAGVQTAVGLMGTALTDEQLGQLARLARRALLCLDGDRAGEDAMTRAAAAAARYSLELQVVPLPNGSDPAQLAQTGGADAITAALKGAVPIARFQVQRILAAGEHRSGEERDRTVERLRPLFAALPASATRLELTQIVADTLQLPAALLEQLLGREGEARADPRASASAVTLDHDQEAERALLAHCIALPDLGAELLRGLDPEEHFKTDSLREVAKWLCVHGLADAGAPAVSRDGGQPVDDVLAGLLVQAERERATPARLEALHQQVLLAALDRQLRRAQAARDGTATEIALRRAHTKASFDAAYARAIEADDS